MKLIKTTVLLIAVVMTLSVVTVMASEPEGSRHDTAVTVTFLQDGSVPDGGGGSSSGGGNSGGNTGGGNGGDNRRSSSSTSFSPSSGIDTVTILDPDIPLADLGDLPKTGGNYLIPMLFVTLGVWMLYAVCRMEPKQKAGIA